MSRSSGVVLLLALAACATEKDPRAPAEAPPKPAPTLAVVPQEPPPSAKVLRDEGPLEEGRVVFQGMVRPTKGGFDVRGVTLDGGETPPRVRLPKGDSGGAPGHDGLLGAVLRVTAELRRVTAEPRAEGEPMVQSRSGSWFVAERVLDLELVQRPVVVEGEIGRSKGLFSVGPYLVERSELAWALPNDGGEKGGRVRLYGQPRIVTCEPNAQCLLGGELPMFDVGRAERLP